jgi:cell division GTPase FtsZ
MIDWLQHADDVLNNAVAGIAEIINVPGHINVDFNDVKTIMGEQGKAMMGTATASRHRPRAHRRRAGRRFAAAGRHRPVGRARRAGQRHRLARPER